MLEQSGRAYRQGRRPIILIDGRWMRVPLKTWNVDLDACFAGNSTPFIADEWSRRPRAWDIIVSGCGGKTIFQGRFRSLRQEQRQSRMLFSISDALH